MPDNNGNLTDKLSVEISASVNPAIKAIDSLQTKLNLLSGSLQHFTDAGKYRSALDNMASGFERLNQVVSGIDFDALANVSSGINNVSKAMTKFSDATRNIERTLSGTTKSAETLASAVERELTQEFNKLGITGDKEIKELSEGFADLGKSFNDMTDGVPDAWDATEAKLGEMKQKLRDMSSVADETAVSMKDVLAVYDDMDAPTKEVKAKNAAVKDFLVRTNIPAELQGRAWGFLGFISQLGYVVAYSLSGVTADAIGKVTGKGVGAGSSITIIGAGICLVIVAVAMSGIKKIRELEKSGLEAPASGSEDKASNAVNTVNA